MNALLPLFTAAGDAADQKAANLLAAARALTPHLNRSRALDRKLVLCGRRWIGKGFVRAIGRGRSCVRPVDAARCCCWP
jgi:hypothetical protein